MGRLNTHRSILGALLLLCAVAVLPSAARAERYSIRVFLWEKSTRQWVPYVASAVVLQIGTTFTRTIPFALPSGAYEQDIELPNQLPNPNRVIVWVGPNRYNEFTYQGNMGDGPTEPGILGGLQTNDPHNNIKVFIRAMY